MRRTLIPMSESYTKRAQPTTVVWDSPTVAELQIVLMTGTNTVRHPLPTQGSVVVGRGEDIDVQIVDASVSRRHTRLHVGEGRVELEDLGSSNGTFAHGRRLDEGERIIVNVNDVVRIGGVVMLLEVRAALPAKVLTTAALQRCLRDHGEPKRPCAIVVVVFEDPVSERAGQELARLALHSDDAVAPLGSHELGVFIGSAGVEHEIEITIARLLSSARERHGRCRVVTRRAPADGLDLSRLLDEARVEAAQAAPNLDGIVVLNRKMLATYSFARQVANSSLSVLVVGETGVGKEHVAEYIHRTSDRAVGQFVRINCAAFAETLFESEFFGYERGAFTGAHQAKPGLLEHAGRGTVFLDELGEMPMSVQAKLLRVLEERQVSRIGALQPRQVHARFVAATNRSLSREVERGTFRKDLYFRLAGVELVIPPLRERRDEILPLAEIFLRRVARELGRITTTPSFTPAAMTALCGHGWDGNVRELRNVVERALLLCGGVTVDVDHLLLPVNSDAGLAESAMRVETPTPAPPDDAGSQQEGGGNRARLVSAMQSAGGNQKEAARILGISRRTISNWLDKYGVTRPRKAHR
jgi:two-component system, NtrC family, response regulator AtoC